METVRAARPGDAPSIARVYVETWRSAYAGLLPDTVLVGMSVAGQAARWRGAIEGQRRDGDFVLVAESGRDGIVGVAGAGSSRPGEERFAGEVYTLYVLPDHQEAGWGSALLRGAFSRLLLSGRPSALVWVLSDNPARFFYEAMGGVRVGERRERLWGADLSQTAYGWSDLDRSLRTWGARRYARS